MGPFEIIGEVIDIETIAVDNEIDEAKRLRNQDGHGRWRKLQGIVMIRRRSGRVRKAELHWYEAHGVGKREIKRKRYLE